jgi:CheY-like chemotaxis protein
MMNLLSNAIKFTEKGEVVAEVRLVAPVTTSTEGDRSARLRFEVRDTGIGIPAQSIKRVFESFVQADGSTTRKHGGTGLGLAIVKKLIEKMGGDVHIESEVGRGSRFWFECPFAIPGSGLQAAPVIEDFADVRILIADDNATNRTVLGRYLQAWGCDFEQVDNGADAVERLRQAAGEGRPYRAALLDMQMPGMDGDQTASVIRACPQIRETVLLCLTSNGVGADVEEVRRAGFDGRLSKPIRRSALRELLKEALSAEAIASRRSVPSPDPVVTPQRDGRILVADDNAVNRAILMRFLEKAGYLVDVVADGSEAVEKVKRGSYSLVLMDVQMPILSGLDATLAIRKLAGAVSRIPVIALTAGAMAEDRKRCIASGMNDYLSKPVKMDELQKIVTRWSTYLPQTALSGQPK